MDLSDRQWELIKHFSPSKKHATKEIFLYMNSSTRFFNGVQGSWLTAGVEENESFHSKRRSRAAGEPASK